MIFFPPTSRSPAVISQDSVQRTLKLNFSVERDAPKAKNPECGTLCIFSYYFVLIRRARLLSVCVLQKELGDLLETALAGVDVRISLDVPGAIQVGVYVFEVRRDRQVGRTADRRPRPASMWLAVV